MSAPDSSPPPVPSPTTTPATTTEQGSANHANGTPSEGTSATKLPDLAVAYFAGAKDERGHFSAFREWRSDDALASNARNYVTLSAPSAPPAPAPGELEETERLIASAQRIVDDAQATHASMGRFDLETPSGTGGNLSLKALTALLPRVAQLVAAARLLPEFIHEDDDCQYDHHGYCQAHSLHERPCPHERAKALLAARASRPPEETDGH